jgi:hypothetical protein
MMFTSILSVHEDTHIYVQVFFLIFPQKIIIMSISRLILYQKCYHIGNLTKVKKVMFDENLYTSSSAGTEALNNVFFFLKSSETQNFITIKTSWNTND